MDNQDGALGRLTKEEIRDLLAKGWLTHDGMWFVHAAAELGVEGANSLNRSAIRSMAEIEVRRLVEGLGVDPEGLETANEVGGFIADGLAVLAPGSVTSRIRVTVPGPHIVRVEWDDGECFAYKGMKRAGLLNGYECGVIYRIECWLEALGIRHRVDPPPGRCQMRTNGGCATEIHL